MLAKFLTIIFIFLNPFSSLIPVEPPMSLSLSDDFNPRLANIVFSIANPNFLPIRNWSINQPEIEAKATLIFGVEKNKILYQKNIEQVLPIASLTKLMTGLIVLEKMDLDQVITISQEAVKAYGDNGGLVIDEKISVKNLLYVLLMESSNDAAVALAEVFKEVPLVDLMNKKAEELGLENTHFTDPTGYNPTNLSTALDLAELVKYSLEQPLIWQILKTPNIDLSSADGLINHHLINTNQLLGHWSGIIGGKTGYTDEAQGCMILVIEQIYENLVIIVLGAEERFLATEKLINWAKKAYIW